jgi:hypothetical protein
MAPMIAGSLSLTEYCCFMFLELRAGAILSVDGGLVETPMSCFVTVTSSSQSRRKKSSILRHKSTKRPLHPRQRRKKQTIELGRRAF